MNLKEYAARAASFIAFSDKDADQYLNFGYKAEAGELWGVLAKHKRKGLNLTSCRVGIADELGDCLWMHAVYGLMLGNHNLFFAANRSYLMSYVLPRNCRGIDPVMNYSQAGLICEKLSALSVYDMDVLPVVYSFALLFGISPASILRLNLLKLNLRRQNGTIAEIRR